MYRIILTLALSMLSANADVITGVTAAALHLRWSGMVSNHGANPRKLESQIRFTVS
jgi:hypothetical protein